MTTPRSVERENRYLKEHLGTEHGQARYQWAWSSNLTMPMVLLDENSKPIYDFHCNCGMNVSVHSAMCRGFSIPKARWEVRNFCPDFLEQWVLCRWLPPEASRDDWQRSFPGQPYPSRGYLVPVGTRENTIRIPSGQVPERATSAEVVRAIRAHEMQKTSEYVRGVKDAWKANEEKLRAKLEQNCKDVFPVHLGLPGQKNEWSHGGMQDVQSPALRTGTE